MLHCQNETLNFLLKGDVYKQCNPFYFCSKLCQISLEFLDINSLGQVRTPFYI